MKYERLKHLKMDAALQEAVSQAFVSLGLNREAENVEYALQEMSSDVSKAGEAYFATPPDSDLAAAVAQRLQQALEAAENAEVMYEAAQRNAVNINTNGSHQLVEMLLGAAQYAAELACLLAGMAVARAAKNEC